MVELRVGVRVGVGVIIGGLALGLGPYMEPGSVVKAHHNVIQHNNTIMLSVVVLNAVILPL